MYRRARVVLLLLGVFCIMISLFTEVFVVAGGLLIGMVLFTVVVDENVIRKKLKNSIMPEEAHSDRVESKYIVRLKDSKLLVYGYDKSGVLGHGYFIKISDTVSGKVLEQRGYSDSDPLMGSDMLAILNLYEIDPLQRDAADRLEAHKAAILFDMPI
jgi:hypothetical protein